MRSRARRRSNTIDQNLDSFLDVLTNTVGVLMFISLFVTLIATGGSSKSKITIQTPLSSDTDKDSLWFEIDDNKVSHLNLRQVREKELELSSNLPNCNKPSGSIGAADYAFRQDNYQSCLLSILGRQSNFRATTQNYDVRAVDEGVSLLFQPNSNEIGENTSQLVAKDSQFRQTCEGHRLQLPSHL